MLSSIPEMMMTTTMMMPPPKKARHNYYSYMETDRLFHENNTIRGGSFHGFDEFSPRAIVQSSRGSQMSRELSADLEEFQVLGHYPGGHSRAVHLPQGQHPRSSFHRSKDTSMTGGFSLDCYAVGPHPGTQRISRPYAVEHPTLRVDTIELPRRTTTTTPSMGAEPMDAPLDLSTADGTRRTFDDQTMPRSGNSSLLFTGRSTYDSSPAESDGGQRPLEKTVMPQLPLFVNLENSRLDSIQLGLHSRRDHDEKENDETKFSDQANWQTITDCDVEPSRKQKNAIDRLRAHLERRQEARPASGTAYANLSKHLAAIDATGNRYDAMHSALFEQLPGSHPSRLKSSFPSIAEAEAQGRRSYMHCHSEKEISVRNPEVSYEQKRCLTGGLSNGGLQQKQHNQRVKETEACLQNATQRGRDSSFRGDELYSAVTVENEWSSRKSHPSEMVVIERHPTNHPNTSGHSMEQTQNDDIQLQDRVLTAISPDFHPTELPDFNVTKATLITYAGRPGRRGVESEPDSPSSHSLPDFYRSSDLTQSQTPRRPASTDTGFPSSKNRPTKNFAAKTAFERSVNGGWLTLEPCSPDQSNNSTNYSADNLPAIIAHARLDDDCEFTSSFVETAKETTMTTDHPHPHPYHPIDNSSNASLRNRRNAVRSGSVGTGKSSSPEPPSSTFEDELVTERSKDDESKISTKSTESAIPCKICQDVANGFHYGVWSCEGCKAFFKRSITGAAKYVCPADNNCTINRLRKKSCQACRLRKCYEYGMSPGNCRGENGNKTRKRRLQEADRKEETKNSVNGDYRRINGASNRSPSDNVHLPVPTVNFDFHNQPTVTEPSSGPASILQHLLAVERPIRLADFVDVRKSTDAADSERIQLLTSITKLVNLQLMDIVTWSRSLPGFSSLNLHIRTHLLVSSWSEILLLTNAFYSLQCTTNAIAIAPNLHLTKEQCEAIGMTALHSRLMAIVKSFQQLALTHEEMLLMQALLLVNSDLTAPQLIPCLDGLRASLMRSWHQSCSGGRGGQGPVDYDRISRLLMLLPHIRHCSILFQRFLTDFKRDSRIPFHGFLQEVTDGRHEFDQMSVLELLVEEEARL